MSSTKQYTVQGVHASLLSNLHKLPRNSTNLVMVITIVLYGLEDVSKAKCKTKKHASRSQVSEVTHLVPVLPVCVVVAQSVPGEHKQCIIALAFLLQKLLSLQVTTAVALQQALSQSKKGRKVYDCRRESWETLNEPMTSQALKGLRGTKTAAISAIMSHCCLSQTRVGFDGMQGCHVSWVEHHTKTDHLAVMARMQFIVDPFA